MKSMVERFVKDESGATAIEYGLIAALIAVGIIIAAKALGAQIATTLGKVTIEMAKTN
jgi:pilus assembly protein Flp/PilA